MSREYTVKFSEKEIKEILSFYKNIYDSCVKTKGYRDKTMQKLIQAKEKSYTNFDKIKDEMIIDKLQRHCSPAILQHISSMSEDFRKICKDRYKNDKKGCNSEICCEECCKNWLESEVKE